MEAVRPPEPRRDPPLAITATARPREGRVRQALRCPFCHDQVLRGVWGPAGSSGGHVVACARRGCGALYHRECWQECARFDGCAALACGSRQARELSALGYVVRVVRLLVAALLFPRRVVQAMGATKGEGLVSVFRLALGRAWELLPAWDSSKNGPLKLLLFMAVATPLAVGVPAVLYGAEVFDERRLLLLMPVVICVASFGAVFLVALAGTTVFYLLRALAVAFASELGALARGDAPAVRAPRVDPKKGA